ncbi:Formin binding protein (FNB3) [Penicillium atrosanguineum]|uniref:Formin binding protein (FNB3) n=1 Tax=Penicillium atrosanguineum TaxID=1132637 RepID=UPI00238242BD|nr:Formin binding protein (FNB3) [Penicillium atrosanguineum]KAJ5289654.1 Formin binding protein (FNB3) [Penicillium atrosanguineum]
MEKEDIVAMALSDRLYWLPNFHWARFSLGMETCQQDKEAAKVGICDQKTYNSRDSLVVTHPTTNLPACGLSTAERTGSPVLHTLWSYSNYLI